MNYENLTKEQLINEIYQLQTRQKYGLIFEDNLDMDNEALKSLGHIPMFEEIHSRCITGGGIDHLLLEGDNYPALLALSSQYKGRIDVIYIDPPYNTGNDGFIYRDSWKHSDWLSFMNRRLYLARELLSDNGVIFISIDDNEQAQLKLLCDQVFGENCVKTIIWKKDEGKGRKNNKIINIQQEYIISILKTGLSSNKAIPENMSNPDKDIRGNWFSASISSPITNDKAKNVFEIKINGKIYKRRWWANKDVIQSYIDDNRIYIPPNGDVPRLKKFRKDFEQETKVFNSILDNCGGTTSGNLDFEMLGLDEKFNNPKPVDLIQRIVSSCDNKNAIILDFFAGSGTTLHAVAELNKEDGGQRKCILITNNENQICENITYQRCKKVINGYITTEGKIVDPTGGNLYYYKLNWVKRNKNEYQMRQSIKDYIPPLICMAKQTHNVFVKDEAYDIYQNQDKSISIIILKRSTPDIIKKLKIKIKDINSEIEVYQFNMDGEVENDILIELGIPDAKIYDLTNDIIKNYENFIERLKYD